MRKEWYTYMETAGFDNGFLEHRMSENELFSTQDSTKTDSKSSWKKFEKTGSISDYLSYSACTKE